MTVIANDRRKEYLGNGVKKSYIGPRVATAAQLKVYLVDNSTGVPTLLTAGYSLIGVGKSSTTVNFSVAPPATVTVLLLRVVLYEQTHDASNQGAFLPETWENAGLDPLAMQTQQLDDRVERALRGPDVSAGTGWTYDGMGRRIANLAPGTATTDAATFGQVLDLVQAGVSNPNGALFQQTGAGAVGRTVNTKLRDTYPTVKDNNAVADGVTDDTLAIAAMEAEPSFSYIDLMGKTVKTTLAPSGLGKKYFNGQLLGRGVNLATERIKPQVPVKDYSIERPRTKSPVLDWSGRNILWLGTSIPHQGVGSDGYPELFARALGCTVTNMAWSGSTAMYNRAGDPMSLATIKALSMTEDDRLAGLALHGPTSVYDDSFDVTTKASQMTCDFRIRQKFAATPFSVVMLDHAHNDRLGNAGTLAPETLTITAITKGATTTVSVSSIGSLAVGDSVALSINGIDKLNYAAGRVQSVAGNTFVLNVNSAAYLGAFVSGTVAKLDKATIYGAWEFLINAIYNAALVNDVALPKIVLAGAPSEFTNGVPDNAIFSVGRFIKDVADKWGLAFFDVGHLYDVKLFDHPTYFPDAVHPTTVATRQAIANHWVQWASGGAIKLRGPDEMLLKGGTSALVDQREALYSRFTGGFSTPKFIIGSTLTNVVNDAFASMGTWTANAVGGGTAPTVVAAPWGAGNAVRCIVANSGDSSYISKSGLTFDNYVSAEFDLYLPAVTGLTPTSSTKTVNLMHLRNAGAYHGLSLLIKPGSVSLLHQYFKSPNVNLVSVVMNPHVLVAGTKHRVRVETVKAGAGYFGGILVFLDNVLISAYLETDDSAQPTPDRVFLGVISTNAGAALTLYIGNALYKRAAVSDYSNRFTGSFVVGAQTVTVVNGIIVSVA